MKIYNGTTELEVFPTERSFRYRSIKNITTLNLYFSAPNFLEIPLGSYVEYEGEIYTLEKPENFKKISNTNYSYTLTLSSSQAKLSKYKIRNLIDHRLKFSYTTNPEGHLQLLVDNLNSRDSGWAVGTVLDSTDKVISYNHTSCDTALDLIADTFETEYEVVGKTINLGKVEYNKSDPLELSYGKGNGFKSGVGRSNYDDSKPCEILFVQGGESNIDSSVYGSTELLLPKNQTYTYEGREYISDADGLSIKRNDKDLSTNNEDSLDLSEIYPKRVGTISSVEVESEENNFYNIIDSSIPEALDFSACRIAGETMTIIFQSGILAGKEFDIEQTDESLTGYIHSERKFKLVPSEIDGQVMPNSTYIPSIGDTYAVFHCAMPDAYISDDTTQTGASWDMFKEGVKYLYEHEDSRFTFKGELDGIWSKNQWTTIGAKIKLGGYILFTDEHFAPDGVLIRIVGIKDFIYKPYAPTIEISNNISSGTVISELAKIDSNEVVIEDKHKESLQFTKRRFRDAKETISLLEEALLEEFTSSISPITVQTMLVLLGDESLQYRFVDNKTSPSKVSHSIAYDESTKVLTSASGIIQHMTLGISSISNSHGVSEYKFWDMAAYTSPTLSESSQAYYLYAKVSSTGTTGEFLLSETAIGINDDASYYHLLVGILNSEQAGTRSFASLYGYTEILPSRITTPLITSEDGKTYINLDTGEIGGKITFTNSDGTQEAITDALNNKSKTWYLNTDPASGWDITEAAKHVGDIWYNPNTKKWYNYVFILSSYGWYEMYDAAAIAAAQAALNAQNTANSKKRNFISTPFVPYDIGDTWTNGSVVYRCTTAKNALQAYSFSDWDITADGTKTTIDGGVVTTGTITLANSTIVAGITGEGGTSAVRIWAGASYANRYSAPFRVYNDGSIYASKSTIEGTSIFRGALEGATGSFSGSLSAATGSFKGSLDAATGTFKGALSAATGSFSGAVSAGSATFTGPITHGMKLVTFPTTSGEHYFHCNCNYSFYRVRTNSTQCIFHLPQPSAAYVGKEIKVANVSGQYKLRVYCTHDNGTPYLIRRNGTAGSASIYVGIVSVVPFYCVLEVDQYFWYCSNTEGTTDSY